MAQLDPLLQALLERNAEELVLSDGQKPAFRFGDQLRPVSKRALNQGQILSLLTELADQIDAARIASGQPARFVYEGATGAPFVCELETEGGRCHARLAPSSDAGSGGERVTPEAAPPPASVPEPTVTPTAAPVASVAPAPIDGPEIERYLRQMVELGASDLHLSAEEAPMVRKDGEMMRLPDSPVIGPDRTRDLVERIMPEINREQFQECHDTDFGYEIADLARFRANVFRDRKGVGAVFRVIPSRILTAEDLGLPEAVLGMCELRKGLVLVTGPTGSGKSTTLAAMIDHINRSRADHIITIEDPIEFVHPNRKCLVNQREVVTHTRGFKPALRAALREDPDIVLVGEMRDLETVAIAIETAETGHLVFGTLHTSTACSTVERIIDQFPADRQSQIRTMLSESLKGVVSQTLLKKAGGGRVAALEVLVVTPAIANLIREGKTFQMPSLMQTGRNLGMCMLNEALIELVKSKLVDPDEAHAKAADKTGFARLLQKSGFRLQSPATS